MKRLVRDDVVALSVGEATIECRVAVVSAGEVGLTPVRPSESALLPAASAAASLVFSHGGQLVMLRGAMYRASGPDDIRFARTARAGAPAVAQQRRKTARIPVTLPASVTLLDEAGRPFGEERRLITRDVSLGGFALDTGVGKFTVGATVRFELVLTDGAMIGGTARVVRTASGLAGLQFEHIAPAERVRLAGFLARWQTSRAAHPTAAAPPAQR